MLDIKFIRENKELVKEGARKKRIEINIDILLSLDDKRIELIRRVEEIRRKQNVASDEIREKFSAQKNDPEYLKERSLAIEVLRRAKIALQKDEEELKKTMEEWRRMMLTIPNTPDVSVPEGESDADNVEVRKIGAPKQIQNPKNHIDLMLAHRMVDFERGTKVAGFRGYFLKNDGALLSVSLMRYVFDFFARKGFEYMIAPALLKKEGLLGTGYLPQGEEDLYKTQDGTYLSGTAEVAVMHSFMDEVFDKKDLPKKVLAFSPCFRREAGSHGKDTKGIFRVHEFFKLEQVVLCEARHEESVKYHEEVTAHAEDLMKSLEIPYRVVVNCGGDLGLGQVKKYDIEAWVPSENGYRETHSSSYFHDFQTRRLNIKYRDDDGKTKFAHSLNNTALATPRIMVSLLENHQEKDGSIRIPDALHNYFGKSVIR